MGKWSIRVTRFECGETLREMLEKYCRIWWYIAFPESIARLRIRNFDLSNLLGDRGRSFGIHLELSFGEEKYILSQEI